MSSIICTSCHTHIQRPPDGTPEAWLYQHACWELCECGPGEYPEDYPVERVGGVWRWKQVPDGA